MADLEGWGCGGCNPLWLNIFNKHGHMFAILGSLAPSPTVLAEKVRTWTHLPLNIFWVRPCGSWWHQPHKISTWMWYQPVGGVISLFKLGISLIHLQANRWYHQTKIYLFFFARPCDLIICSSILNNCGRNLMIGGCIRLAFYMNRLTDPRGEYH